ncbi:MAG: DUF6231 family protein [Marinobacter sp.]|uniref:DUF6231 family protein n=1 Tax=Marinobacter sp. TaxID=50741 RepID=UPI00299E9636|nr:DUF6231 family protein [Marinobacter sp.]MDX1633612.1 DUF6231 family protein [Marinobacter sp.]
MAPSPTSVLQDLISHCQPRRLLAIGPLAGELARAWLSHQPEAEIAVAESPDIAAEADLSRPHDLALVTDTLEALSPQQAILLLGHLRNFGTQQIAALSDDHRGLEFSDFIGLGFVRQAHFEGPPPQTLFTYNLASYNRKRDWNNARNWANPEMWDKARW